MATKTPQMRSAPASLDTLCVPGEGRRPRLHYETTDPFGDECGANNFTALTRGQRQGLTHSGQTCCPATSSPQAPQGSTSLSLEQEKKPEVWM